MSAIQSGAIRGAIGGAAVVFAIVALPFLLDEDPVYRVLIFVLLALAPGALCGAVAGWIIGYRRPWWQAAVVSSFLAVTAVIGLTVLLTDGQLRNDPTGSAVLMGVLCAGGAVVAVWQSWALSRRFVSHSPTSTATETAS